MLPVWRGGPDNRSLPVWRQSRFANLSRIQELIERNRRFRVLCLGTQRSAEKQQGASKFLHSSTFCTNRFLVDDNIRIHAAPSNSCTRFLSQILHAICYFLTLL